jgi:hypothetical protein
VLDGKKLGEMFAWQTEKEKLKQKNRFSAIPKNMVAKVESKLNDSTRALMQN